ncbi:ethylene-responsive transcription factor ERF027-like [Magnolia sinica]|uniref:ethylene-responsive transcription factor ERF027-like n=1 Tax=Magnolia sinica TaxID=86752 RepID=UPI0026592569|nr:ethylene-responsive transcription factor ERF027-like [Magnolia sinica]
MDFSASMSPLEVDCLVIDSPEIFTNDLLDHMPLLEIKKGKAKENRKVGQKSKKSPPNRRNEADPVKCVNLSPPENVLYMDEEAIFDMPGLLASRAERLLLSPPPYVPWDDVEGGDDVSLWSYSI